MPGSDQPERLAFGPEFEFLRFNMDHGTGFVLTGDLDSAGARSILRALDAEPHGGGLAEFLMEEAELTDGVSVTRMVEAVRLLLARYDRVQLVRSPQALAHSLYRVGMLKGASRLFLIEPREDEGGGAG